uniref:BZIP domain-containing protein n=1 Tax=Chlamydomonas euryale TaxID=1486919 RepID=A0A7R9Z0L9_9CHLO|mmetsp:Transcript_39262/g.116809  ORF Transcript_39262/g.116809 Transcript_39262/m.116809 type:complete len:269 (+) Transcript_39262:74-880(+)
MGSETATGTGGLWRPVAGFPRTDSESAFQEFLKKIPSNQNLASLASGGLEAGGALGSGLQAASLGIPRVSSFDLLRNLGSTKAEAKPAAQGIGLTDLGSTPVGVAPLLPGGTPPLSMGTSASPAGPSGPGSRPALTARAGGSAAPQARGSRSTSAGARVTRSEPTESDGSDDDPNDGKKEQRKARRMLSNRESARRSRRRKQEHLQLLENEISALVEEQQAWNDKRAAAERRMSTVREEGQRLREENARLRDELQFLRSEFKASGREV